MSLERYLAAIRRGEPINYAAFVRRLPAPWRARHRELFATERVATDRWRVTCREPAQLEALEARVRRPRDRLEATRQGDSHRAAGDTAYLLVHHLGLPDARPGVVLLQGRHVLQGFTPRRTALIVENEQNFARPRAMRRLASRWSGLGLGPEEADVILGGGSRINRRAVVDWLSGYERVVCAFDYDLGGLRMFASLRDALGERASLLQPPAWPAWHDRFRRHPGDTGRALAAVALAERLGLHGLARAFRETGHFMEQEILLEPMDD